MKAWLCWLITWTVFAVQRAAGQGPCQWCFSGSGVEGSFCGRSNFLQAISQIFEEKWQIVAELFPSFQVCSAWCVGLAGCFVLSTWVALIHALDQAQGHGAAWLWMEIFSCLRGIGFLVLTSCRIWDFHGVNSCTSRRFVEAKSLGMWELMMWQPVDDNGELTMQQVWRSLKAYPRVFCWRWNSGVQCSR